jgi:hypothetical protein
MVEPAAPGRVHALRCRALCQKGGGGALPSPARVRKALVPVRSHFAVSGPSVSSDGILKFLEFAQKTSPTNGSSWSTPLQATPLRASSSNQRSTRPVAHPQSKRASPGASVSPYSAIMDRAVSAVPFPESIPCACLAAELAGPSRSWI